MSDFKYHYNLCECGRPKKDTSKKCRACSRGSGAICPVCGGPKSKKGKVCRSCAFPGKNPEDLIHRRWYGNPVDYSNVPEDYLRAFSGFLMGEGCIAIGCTPNFSPRVDVGIHVDDVAALELAQSYLGGSIYFHSNRPLATWRLQGLLPVRELLTLVRQYAGPLGAIKLKDVDIALEYISWRLGRPHHLGPDDKVIQKDFVDKLSSVKVRSSL